MWTGFFLLGIRDIPDVSWSHFSLTTFYETVRPFILPFTLGALTLSILGALLAYPLALFMIVRYRQQARRSE